MPASIVDSRNSSASSPPSLIHVTTSICDLACASSSQKKFPRQKLPCFVAMRPFARRDDADALILLHGGAPPMALIGRLLIGRPR